MQREVVWVAVHSAPDAKRRGLLELAPHMYLDGPAKADALSYAAQNATLLAILAKTIDRQASMLQTIQHMEKELERTRVHQEALQNILETLDEPVTPATTTTTSTTTETSDINT